MDAPVLKLTGERAIAWITRNLVRFSPWGSSDISNTGLQALSELAIAWAHLQPVLLRLQWSAGALDAWRDTVTGYCEDPLYARAARSSPARAMFVLLPYLMLRSSGYRWPRHEDTLVWMQRLGFPRAAETIPYRQLDRQYFLWKGGCLPREPNWSRLCQNTSLQRVCSGFHVDDETAYSITHTLLYLSQFGTESLKLDAPLERRAVNLVDRLLPHYWRTRNWDLLGELLINATSITSSDSVIFAGATDAFGRSWRHDGAHPANGDAERRILQTSDSDSDAQMFRFCYHTTLVGLMHCAALANR